MYQFHVVSCQSNVQQSTKISEVNLPVNLFMDSFMKILLNRLNKMQLLILNLPCALYTCQQFNLDW